MADVIVLDNLAQEGLDQLSAAEGISYEVRTGLKGDDLRETLARFDGAICRSGVKITAESLTGNKRLRAIVRAGVGTDNIDKTAATRAGIVVMNTPSGNTLSTAEHTMALMLALSRNIAPANQSLIEGRWDRKQYMGSQLAGKTLGIVGLGRIGQAVARRARGFGLSIHYHNRRRHHPDVEGELEATYWESLDQMLARMDIISVNCPHTPATYHLLSERRLKLLQPHAYIVNTSRGEVIDENALTRLLRAGDIGGAGLDVFEHAPAVNPKLLELDNVVLLPHMGSATFEGRIDMGEKVVVNIKTFTDGHKPPDRVLGEGF